jgi:hypothetical protein
MYNNTQIKEKNMLDGYIVQKNNYNILCCLQNGIQFTIPMRYSLVDVDCAGDDFLHVCWDSMVSQEIYECRLTENYITEVSSHILISTSCNKW